MWPGHGLLVDGIFERILEGLQFVALPGLRAGVGIAHPHAEVDVVRLVAVAYQPADALRLVEHGRGIVGEIDAVIKFAGRECADNIFVDRQLVLARGQTRYPQRLVVEVSGGSAHVSDGGFGRVRCGIGMLSSWYSGTMRTHDAVQLGLLEAAAEDQAVMDSLIGDREAWMPDFF